MTYDNELFNDAVSAISQSETVIPPEGQQTTEREEDNRIIEVNDVLLWQKFVAEILWPSIFPTLETFEVFYKQMSDCCAMEESPEKLSIIAETDNKLNSCLEQYVKTTKDLRTMVEKTCGPASVIIYDIITHDIKNLLCSRVTIGEMIYDHITKGVKIDGIIDLLHKSSDEFSSDKISDIRKEILGVLGKVDDRYLAKAGTRNPKRPTSSVISQTVEEAFDRVPLSALSNIGVSIKVSEEMESVRFPQEPILLSVMRELMADSILAIGAGRGTLTITVSRIEKNAILSVTDDGPGMSQDTVAKIMKSNFSTKPNGTGGRGLALCILGIKKYCHGSLTVDSQLGIGTTFSIEIPLSKNPE